jgi:mono/diheme cytochrome c family protein
MRTERVAHRNLPVWLIMMAIVLGCTVPLLADERNLFQPRVPADKLAEARALTNPLPNAPDVIEKGKGLYNGKGTCFNCHGSTGRGDGIVARGLEPSPRNFHDHGFWKHRTDGEVFWVIKHGSPGTAMIGLDDVLTDEEIWAIIRYEQSLAGDHGPG